MLRLLSRGLLVSALSLGYVAVKAQPVYAEDDEEEDEGGDEDEGGGSSGGDDGEEEEEDDKDQPSITSGGLFTMKTYPVREISRPLTMTEGIMQARISAGTDISAKGAFESGGLSVEGIYGYRDNVNIIGGFTNAYNFKQFAFYGGFEAALIYDVLDIRLAANVHRSAIPQFSNFCTPVSSNDPANPMFPSECGGATPTPDASLVNLPNGVYEAGGTKFSIDIGFPFRYAIKPEIAIVALATLMSIDFNSVSKDHVIASKQTVTDPMGVMSEVTVNTPVGNGAKPDLNPSIGIATNPVAPLSVVIYAQLRISDFDTAAGAFQVPVTGRIEFSPNQKFDIGLEFTLLNVKPPEGQSPIDNRFLALFVQSRFGK